MSVIDRALCAVDLARAGGGRIHIDKRLLLSTGQWVVHTCIRSCSNSQPRGQPVAAFTAVPLWLVAQATSY
jgi:hypothetical protein